jgi:acetyl esterase/lipase
LPEAAAQRPIVVFWYGGTWIRGSREQYRFVGAALASAGYVAIIPDYALFPHARFPQFIEDGARAVHWAHEHASEIGGDPNAMFLMGHSAGAHIAATLALDRRYLQKTGGDPDWVRGWIGLSGPYALELRVPLLEQIFQKPYAPADWQPIALVRERAPVALLVHGTNDTLVHPREAVELAAKLRAAGVPVECRIYAGSTHFDTIAAFSLPLRRDAPSLADVRQFINRTMAATATGQLPVMGPACAELRLRREWSPGKPLGFNGE